MLSFLTILDPPSDSQEPYLFQELPGTASKSRRGLLEDGPNRPGSPEGARTEDLQAKGDTRWPTSGTAATS